MKLYLPQISWHNRGPVLCLDIAKIGDLKDQIRLATGGTDCKVYIWSIDKEGEFIIQAGLRRHQRSVGAVRFSPNGDLLASGDDDGYIYLWKITDSSCKNSVSNFNNDDDVEDLETWKQVKILRGHVEDICDIAWSKDGTLLISGSVDNSAILWDAEKGTKVWCSDTVRGYIQGVAFDPLSQFIVTLSSDGTMRSYNVETKKLVATSRRMQISNDKSKKGFFCDDTLPTFCRRPEFSPCGKFLLVPAGQLTEGNEKPISVCYLFDKTKLNKPHLYYPTKETALCVRFCPIMYKLRESEKNLWSLPYRLVFAIATSRTLLIYDSQQPTPICFATNIHMARITDLAWSHDASSLMASSYDGYCTRINFDTLEFGDIYIEAPREPTPPPPPPPPVQKPAVKPAPKPVPKPVVNDLRKYMILKKI